MFILPYNTELRLASRPYVVYSIILLCFIIFYFQLQSNKRVDAVFESYCASIQAKEGEETDEYDYMRRSPGLCYFYLYLLHYRSNPEDWIEYQLKTFKDEFSRELLEKYAVFELEHYEEFRQREIPDSLDEKLMYFPETFNPVKMLTSALSHSGWSHIIFNLIFFFAFAPALEIIIRNKLKFIGLIVILSFVIGIAYSLVSLARDQNIPTLGLSGVVTGMIGLSAFLMPQARIRTVFWYFSFARVFSIPAWILAAWFIGWDIYDLFTRTSNGGVNLTAHVTGGLAGYFFGVMFFKKEKQLAQYELNLEIDYMRSKREGISSIATLFKGDRAYVDNKQREEQARRDFERYSETLYRYVKAGKTGEANLHLLEKYDLFANSPEIYIDLFHEIGQWKKKRVYFCTARLIIDLLIENKKYGLLAEVIKSVLEEDPDFVIGDPKDLLIIINQLISFHEYKIAYQLVKDAEKKYNSHVNLVECSLLEARILWDHLDQADKAKEILQSRIDKVDTDDKNKLQDFLRLISA